VRGKPISVLYVEPGAGCTDTLAPLLRDAREIDGALVAGVAEIVPLRELYESNPGSREASGVLDDLLRFCQPRSRYMLDARVARGVLHLQSCYDDRLPVAEVARHVGLSASRFQHLFAEEVGVPFRRYRSWHRLRAAIREVANGANFTAAAHAAGFADQAHFSNEFKRTFGAPPSASLRLARA
jgi:AraC-like DNA-binding protein